uniref:SH3 domain-containing protein n=1 Tax=Bursaphelenchus xylophilus TaxID=6326 RepID=A0A1I7RI03_BURXY
MEGRRGSTSRSTHFFPAIAHILLINVGRRYRVLYPYEPRQSDELELDENDIIFVVEKCEDGWFIGTSLKSGQFGTFPGNYVVKH